MVSPSSQSFSREVVDFLGIDAQGGKDVRIIRPC